MPPIKNSIGTSSLFPVLKFFDVPRLSASAACSGMTFSSPSVSGFIAHGKFVPTKTFNKLCPHAD